MNLKSRIESQVAQVIAGAKDKDAATSAIMTLFDELKSNQIKAVAEWRKKFEEKQGFLPHHIDIEKILEMVETGEIQDQGLVVDPNQKTLEAFQ